MSKTTLCLQGWGFFKIVNSNTEHSETTTNGFELKWLAVENGSIIWYTDEIQALPEGVGVLTTNAIITDRRLDSNELVLSVNILSSGLAAKMKNESITSTVTRSGSFENQENQCTVELAFVENIARHWFEILNLQYNLIDRSISIEQIHDKLNHYAFEDDDTKKLVSATMQIHLKGQPHTIHVTPHDDVGSLAENFVQVHKLKPEIRTRIETELLRTQVDACRMSEERLNKRISWLRRRLCDGILSEERASAAEQHIAKLSNSLQKVDMLLPQLQLKFKQAMQSNHDKTSQISFLTEEMITKDAKIEELGNILSSQSSLLDTKEQERLVLAEELEERRMKVEDLEAELKSRCDESEHELELRGKDGTVRSSSSNVETAALTLATQEIKDLKHQKSVLSKQLNAAQEEARKLGRELQLANGKRATLRRMISGVSALQDDTLLSNLSIAEMETDIIDRIKKLEERNKLLKGNLLACDETRIGLQDKCDSLNLNFGSSVLALRRCEDDLLKARTEVKELQSSGMAKVMNNLVAENRTLREEAVKLRGDMVRMNSETQSVKECASILLRTFQSLNPDVSITNLLPPQLQQYQQELLKGMSTGNASPLVSPRDVSTGLGTGANGANGVVINGMAVDVMPQGGFQGVRTIGNENSALRGQNNRYIIDDNESVNAFVDLSAPDARNNTTMSSQISRRGTILILDTPPHGFNGSLALNIPANQQFNAPDNNFSFDHDDVSVFERSVYGEVDLQGHQSPSSPQHRFSSLSSVMSEPTIDLTTKPVSPDDMDKSAKAMATSSISEGVGVIVAQQEVRDNDDKVVTPENKYTWQPPVDILSQSLSFIVEDRLLRTIYSRYVSEVVGSMTLSRFGRFAREFGVTCQGPTSQGQTPPYIVSGDVDMVFMNATKTNPEGEKDRPLPQKPFCVRGQVSSHPQNPIPMGHIGSPVGGPLSPASKPSQHASHAIVGPKFKTAISNPNAVANSPNPVVYMTAGQFIVALEVLAIKLYSKLIERQTGTSHDCLPPRQKLIIGRAAFDVFLKKKVLPVAEQLDILPWPLIYLDQTVTSLSTDERIPASIVRNLVQLQSWFDYYAGPSYSAALQAQITSAYLTPENKKTSLDIRSQRKQSNVKAVTRHSQMEPNLVSGSPSVMSSARILKGLDGDEGAQPKSIGITYKVLSKFAHDFGLVPYLLKEPQLFGLFQEVVLWGRHDPSIIVNALPKEVSYGPYFATASIDTSATSTKPIMPPANLVVVVTPSSSDAAVAKKIPDKVGIGGFIIIISTAATQSFPDLPQHQRLDRLFEWMAQSGGSLLVNRDKFNRMVNDHSQ